MENTTIKLSNANTDYVVVGIKVFATEGEETNTLDFATEVIHDNIYECNTQEEVDLAYDKLRELGLLGITLTNDEIDE